MDKRKRLRKGINVKLINGHYFTQLRSDQNSFEKASVISNKVIVMDTSPYSMHVKSKVHHVVSISLLRQNFFNISILPSSALA